MNLKQKAQLGLTTLRYENLPLWEMIMESRKWLETFKKPEIFGRGNLALNPDDFVILENEIQKRKVS